MIRNDTAATEAKNLLGSLRDYGSVLWKGPRDNADSVLQEMAWLGDHLGPRVEGRAGELQEIISPKASEIAHPRSMSAHYGLGELPLHTELSHRRRPCRFVLLGCLEPGEPPTATLLLDWQLIGFSQNELLLLESAPVLVRNGRKSFYSTILSPERRFFRFDPACLEAVDERGRQVLQIVARKLTTATPVAHSWCRGDILVFDNWRILHGREPAKQNSERRLARMLIDAN